MKANKILLFIGLILFSFCLNAQTRRMLGTVLDNETNQPIAFASVALNGSYYGVITDENGNFSLKLDRKTDSVMIKAFGYRLKVVKTSDKKKAQKIYLIPITTTLGEVNVKGFGPKSIFASALDSVPKHFLYKKNFSLITDIYKSKKINDSLVYLSYCPNWCKRMNILCIRMILPLQIDTEYTNIRTDKDNKLKYILTAETYQRMLFSFDDFVKHYMLTILNYNFLAKEVKNSLEGKPAAYSSGLININTGMIDGNSFKLKIIKEDSVEKEYIITKTSIDTLSSIASGIPMTTSYYIDAPTMNITKIEAHLNVPKDSTYSYVTSMDGKITLSDFVTTVTFREKQGKYFLSNCYSKVIYKQDTSFISQENKKKNLTRATKDDVIEERVVFDTKDCIIKPDEFDIKKIKFKVIVLTLNELIKRDEFKDFFIEKEN